MWVWQARVPQCTVCDIATGATSLTPRYVPTCSRCIVPVPGCVYAEGASPHTEHRIDKAEHAWAQGQEGVERHGAGGNELGYALRGSQPALVVEVVRAIPWLGVVARVVAGGLAQASAGHEDGWFREDGSDCEWGKRVV